jgi:hypothetical protein
VLSDAAGIQLACPPGSGGRVLTGMQRPSATGSIGRALAATATSESIGFNPKTNTMVVVVPPEGSNSMPSERDEDFESLLVMEDGSMVLTYAEEPYSITGTVLLKKYEEKKIYKRYCNT